MSQSKIIVSKGDVTSIRFMDENLIDESNIRQVGREIQEVIELEPTPKILISFEGVVHLSSSTLGILIKAHNSVREKDGQMHICEVNPQIYEAFTITNLDKLLHIHKTTKEALSSFS